MNAESQSAGNSAVISSRAETGPGTPRGPTPSRAPRAGSINIAVMIDAYLAQYAGRDPSWPQRLAWWAEKLGHVRLGDPTDDVVADALDDLATQRGRYWAGKGTSAPKTHPVFSLRGEPIRFRPPQRLEVALGV